MASTCERLTAEEALHVVPHWLVRRALEAIDAGQDVRVELCTIDDSPYYWLSIGGAQYGLGWRDTE